MKANVFQETAAAVAKRFGVSVKALRVYEEAGLLRPARTVAGWRIYRQPEIERLSAILALKHLGLPLKRIGDLLRGSGDLAAALALQEAALEDAKAEAETALALVRSARAKLAERRSLSPDELGKLVRSTAMSEFKWNDKMEALAQKHYTPEQLQELRARPFTAEDQARVTAAWEKIYADIDALGPNAEPGSDAALEIGRRAQALIGEFTQGDPALFKAAGAMNRDAMQDPELAKQLPSQAHWSFMGRVFEALKQSGG
ncbi:MAG TPA: MerR family transcriptional regulator [Vitreimonas sp.]|uniref:MerR family transcriptional regulator n=1 Tax=Vitreimonas sp. TaxID=3069702 RepID=UPI002D261C2A|nr:MerR family transcriptional regulator [Vitreimonas sp.]HYD88586.1 MerR family transcriptional regulator [Vitreimonas sp.]